MITLDITNAPRHTKENDMISHVAALAEAHIKNGVRDCPNDSFLRAAGLCPKERNIYRIAFSAVLADYDERVNR